MAAGVAAQYLQLNPEAGTEDVRAALVDSATLGVVTGAGELAPNRLLFTNFSQEAPAAAQEAAATASDGGHSIHATAAGTLVPVGDHGSNLSSGTIAAIAVPVVVAAVVATAGAAVLLRRRCRRRRQQEGPELGGSAGAARSEWELREDQIEICKRPDGSDWLLGEGSYGQVLKVSVFVWLSAQPELPFPESPWLIRVLGCPFSPP